MGGTREAGQGSGQWAGCGSLRRLRRGRPAVLLLERGAGRSEAPAAAAAQPGAGAEGWGPLTAEALRHLGEVGEQVAAAVEDAVLAVVHEVRGPARGQGAGAGRRAGRGDPTASRPGCEACCVEAGWRRAGACTWALTSAAADRSHDNLLAHHVGEAQHGVVGVLPAHMDEAEGHPKSAAGGGQLRGAGAAAQAACARQRGSPGLQVAGTPGALPHPPRPHLKNSSTMRV